jgi:hypothetical protein
MNNLATSRSRTSPAPATPPDEESPKDGAEEGPKGVSTNLIAPDPPPIGPKPQ